MKTYIYILTDCKRNQLEVGYSENLSSAVEFYKNRRGMFLYAENVPSRLMYTEEFYSEAEAIARFNQMRQYTRQQKERLIRSFNPNWHDLSTTLSVDYHPGAKFTPNVPSLTSFL